MFEGGVVLGDLAALVEGAPGVDFDGEDQVEGGEIELVSLGEEEELVDWKCEGGSKLRDEPCE